MILKSMNQSRKVVLFYIDGPVPSEEDEKIVGQILQGNIRWTVRFRNAQAIGKGETLERCDFVAGNLPQELWEKLKGYENVKGVEALSQYCAVKGAIAWGAEPEPDPEPPPPAKLDPEPPEPVKAPPVKTQAKAKKK